MSVANQTSLVLPAVIVAAEDFVRHELAAMDASHDFAHIQRVRANARSLSAMEGLDAEATALVDLAALLHDVRDWKYSGSDDATTRAVTVRARWLWLRTRQRHLSSSDVLAQAFLTDQGLDLETINRLVFIISRVGFKEELAGANGSGTAPQAPALSLEAAIVQDADRLDAIGAIGIARCFTFGGAKHRVLYDPDVPPRDGLSKEQYMAGGAQVTTINHFYEKLLKLKGMMKTSAGSRIAAGRHAFMEQYLQQFHDEWNGRA